MFFFIIFSFSCVTVVLFLHVRFEQSTSVSPATHKEVHVPETPGAEMWKRGAHFKAAKKGNSLIFTSKKGIKFMKFSTEMK